MLFNLFRKASANKLTPGSELESLVKSIEDFILILDKEKNVLEFYHSIKLQKNITWSEERLGKSLKKACFDPALTQKIEEGLEKVLLMDDAYKTSFSLEWGGKNLWFSANFNKRYNAQGDFSGFAVVLRDVTEEKMEEEVLTGQVEELENIKKSIFNLLEDMEEERKKAITLTGDLEKFKLAVEFSSDHVQIADLEQTVVYMNAAAEKMTGFSAQECIGKNVSSLWRSMDEQLYERFWNTVYDEKKPFISELINKRKNGETYPAAVQIFPILDKKGGIIFFVSIERDITKFKEVDKMKSEFVSLASHQLRTPLSGIKWLTEILLNDKVGTLSVDQKEFLTQIKESNDRMIKLVNDLLDISHIETGEKFNIVKEDHDLIKLINITTKEQLIIAQKKQIEFKYLNPLPAELILHVDDEKILQVLQNFVSNAIKYGNPGTQVVLDLTVNEEVVFMVRNFGIVIGPEEEKSIFSKFYRTDSAKNMDPGGTGLGLYIAKAIIEGHGGKVWFTSKENEGTSFYFSLPKK